VHSTLAADAAALRLSGWSYRRIGRCLRISTATAYRLVQQAASDPDAADLRQAEAERLDRALIHLAARRDALVGAR
jgi:hypothetical protein